MGACAFAHLEDRSSFLGLGPDGLFCQPTPAAEASFYRED
jgi:hypothetical protein